MPRAHEKAAGKDIKQPYQEPALVAKVRSLRYERFTLVEGIRQISLVTSA